MKCYLNLGCGSRFHPDWVNLDKKSNDLTVQIHDLRNGIPYPEQTFDVVYHSHLLEHFPKHKALTFMNECYRVLKPEGIIRVATPDLEQIARLYLQALEKALQGDEDWKHNYNWIVLELYDQTVREQTGGAMIDYLKQDNIVNKKFISERIGAEAWQAHEGGRTPSNQLYIHEENSLVYNKLLLLQYLPSIIRKNILKMFLGKKDYQALQIGRFRLKGEVHKWMYDRYSLANLLIQAGFKDPIQRTASNSAIQKWPQYNLDTEPDGTIYKPDSFYMEAIKP